MTLVWTPCRAKEATALYCLNCERILEDSPFKLGSVKWLHENGSKHSVEYVRLEETNDTQTTSNNP